MFKGLQSLMESPAMMVKKNIIRAAVNWTAPLHVDETVTVRVAVPLIRASSAAILVLY